MSRNAQFSDVANIHAVSTSRTRPLNRAFAAVLLAATAFAGPSLAATDTDTLSVTAEVQETCTITSVDALSFGTIGTLTANVDATGTINVKCTNLTTYDIGLGSGSATGATVSTRKMTGATHNAELSYSLFTDSSRSSNWGETIGTDTASGTGDGTTKAHTVFGRIPIQNAVRADSYSDTVVVTVTY